MNTELQTFSFQSHSLTVLTDEHGEPWFIAKEVCDILEHSNTSLAVSRLDDDEKLIYTMLISGQNREVLLINESGLYSLILTSRKPEAKAFKKWVTSEVLPSIRKTGAYIAPNSKAEAYLTELKSHLDTQKQLISAQQYNHAVYKEKADAYLVHLKTQNEQLNRIIARHDEARQRWNAELKRAVRAQRPITEAETLEIAELYDRGWIVTSLSHWFYRNPAIIRRSIRQAGGVL